MTANSAAMIGIEMLGQCVDCVTETRLDSPNVVFKLKILDIVYSVEVLPNDAATEQGCKDAWQHLLTQFAIRHAAGNRMLYSDGSRDLTDEEKKIKQIHDKKLARIK